MLPVRVSIPVRDAKVMAPRRRTKPTFAGLFSGCGGFDLGFQQSGFRSLAAFDIDADAVSNYNANQKGNAVVCDLACVSSLDLSSPPDVIIAGPPCQGFSTLGLRANDDPRNSLLISAASLAVSANPRVILIENVSGAIAGTHRSYWNSAKAIIEAAGFQSREYRVTGTDFGLPQIRKRIILVAARRNLDRALQPIQGGCVAIRNFLSDVEHLPNHFPRWLTPGSSEYQIAQRILPHQKLCNVRGGNRSIPTWEIPEVFGAVTLRERKLLCMVQRLRRQRRLRPDGDADPLTIQDMAESCDFDPRPIVSKLKEKGYLRQIGRRFDLAHTFNGTYRRLSTDHPSPTVDTRFGQPRYFLHPKEQRGLSAREAARIQGFPDDFVFHGSLTTQFRLIGNAVPPPIGRWFAEMILEHLL